MKSKDKYILYFHRILRLVALILFVCALSQTAFTPRYDFTVMMSSGFKMLLAFIIGLFTDIVTLPIVKKIKEVE